MKGEKLGPGESKVVSRESPTPLIMTGMGPKVGIIVDAPGCNRAAVGLGLEAEGIRAMFAAIKGGEPGMEGALNVSLVGANVLPREQSLAVTNVENTLAIIRDIAYETSTDIVIESQGVLRGKEGYDSVSYTPCLQSTVPYIPSHVDRYAVVSGASKTSMPG